MRLALCVSIAAGMLADRLQRRASGHDENIIRRFHDFARSLNRRRLFPWRQWHLQGRCMSAGISLLSAAKRVSRLPPITSCRRMAVCARAKCLDAYRAMADAANAGRMRAAHIIIDCRPGAFRLKVIARAPNENIGHFEDSATVTQAPPPNIEAYMLEKLV